MRWFRIILCALTLWLAPAAGLCLAQDEHVAPVTAHAPDAPVTAQTSEAATHSDHSADLDMKEYLFGHIGDSYDWHITTFKGHHISIPLPCIVWGSEGPAVFMSSHLSHGGSYGPYRLASEGEKYAGKIVETLPDGSLSKPWDISITKNVLAIMITAALLLWLILACSRWYKRHDVLKEAPTGVAAVLEPVIEMINDEVIKENVGEEHYRRFSPYLLTVFFFILLSNLLGIVPFFPGGANVTGNIAVTMALALMTFIAVNLFGSKHYFKEIFWPDVPVFLKAIPIMPLIEFLGVFTKPMSLMIRLFANILAGHMMILCMVALVFIGAKLGAVLCGSMSLVAVIFGVFLDCLEVLVAFIQAYVFTLLSSVFIGMAHPEHHEE